MGVGRAVVVAAALRQDHDDDAGAHERFADHGGGGGGGDVGDHGGEQGAGAISEAGQLCDSGQVETRSQIGIELSNRRQALELPEQFQIDPRLLRAAQGADGLTVKGRRKVCLVADHDDDLALGCAAGVGGDLRERGLTCRHSSAERGAAKQRPHGNSAPRRNGPVRESVWRDARGAAGVRLAEAAVGAADKNAWTAGNPSHLEAVARTAENAAVCRTASAARRAGGRGWGDCGGGHSEANGRKRVSLLLDAM